MRRRRPFLRIGATAASTGGVPRTDVRAKNIAIAILAVFLGIALIIVGVMAAALTTKDQPPTSTAEAIPGGMNEFWKNTWETFQFGSAAGYRSPTLANRIGYERAYVNSNVTPKLPFLDDLDEGTLLGTTPKERYWYNRWLESESQLRKSENTATMTDPQLSALTELFTASSMWAGHWRRSNSAIEPLNCTLFYRTLTYSRLLLHRDWFDESAPQHVPRTNFANVMPVYNSLTWDAMLKQMEKLRNTMIQARTSAFFERIEAFLVDRYDDTVHYPLHLLVQEVEDALSAADLLWDDSDLGGGSSMFYDSVLLRAAEAGFTPSGAQLADLATKVGQLANETDAYLEYLTVDVPLNIPDLFDSLSGIPGDFPDPFLEAELIWVLGFPYDLHETCHKRGAIEGIWTDDAIASWNTLETEWRTWREIAEPILIAEVPDYLGWSLTWIHVFMGTEANVTDLGNYFPVDCNNGTGDPLDDPAANMLWRETQRLHSALASGGNVGGEFQAIRAYQRSDGCSDGLGQASVAIPNVGDYPNKGQVLLSAGPVQPRDAQIQVLAHEETHVNQFGQLALSCPTCWMYKLYNAITHVSSDFLPVEHLAVLDGGATYVERNVTLQDMASVLQLTDLELAAMALTQITFRVEREGAYIGIGTGQISASAYTTLAQTNNWWPYASTPQAEGIYTLLGDYPSYQSPGYWYRGGLDRTVKLRRDIIANCPKYKQRASDIVQSLPFSMAGAELAIKEFIDSGCSKWPYPTALK